MTRSITAEEEEVLRSLAQEIRTKRKYLATHEPYQHLSLCDQQRAHIRGMVSALTYFLGRPDDLQLAEAFISNEPYWRAML
jgi:hypothetical protein